MLQRALRRLALFPILLLAINAVSFLIVNYLAMKSRFILGPPPLSQVLAGYPAYLSNVLQGNFGELPSTRTPVEIFILEALPKSLILLLLALLIAAVVGMLAGFLSVNRSARRANSVSLIVSLGGFSMPSFYFGIVAIYLMILLSAWTGGTGTLLPAGGYGLDAHLVLPALVLAARPTAEIARVTAELLADELQKDYIRAARAKGLPWRGVMVKHAFRNMASAVIVTLGNSLRYVFSSLLVIETMFSWPGLGRALVSTLTNRGVTQWQLLPELVAAVITVLALLFLLANLITDLSMMAVDPRLRRRA